MTDVTLKTHPLTFLYLPERPTAVGAEVGQQTAMLQTRESPDQPPLQFPRTTGGSQANAGRIEIREHDPTA